LVGRRFNTEASGQLTVSCFNPSLFLVEAHSFLLVEYMGTDEATRDAVRSGQSINSGVTKKARLVPFDCGKPASIMCHFIEKYATSYILVDCYVDRL
jgi:hypothetical protein